MKKMNDKTVAISGVLQNSNYIAKSRGKRTMSNIVISFVAETLILVVGIFLPRAILQNYGDEMNGIVSSIQQIFTYVLLLETGIYGATTIALYKPMAQGNQKQIDIICHSATRLFRILGSIILLFTIALAFAFPYIANQNTLDYSSMVILVCAISINTLAEIFLSAKYSSVLVASQKNGLLSIVKCITHLIYYISIIVFSYMRVEPAFAYAIAASAYLLKAALLKFICRYLFPQLKFKKTAERIKLSKSFDVMLNQSLNIVCLNSTAIILAFGGAQMGSVISVFAIYNLVISSIFHVFGTVTNSILPSFGNLNASTNQEQVRKVYREFETFYQIIWTIIMSCLVVLLIPFVKNYVSGATNLNYADLEVAGLCIAFIGLYLIRNQQTIVLSAQGEFRQMRFGVIAESVLNIGLSILGFVLYGLVGLLIGRVISTGFRTIEILILNNNKRNMISLGFTIKNIMISFLSTALSAGFFFLLSSHIEGWFSWIRAGVAAAIISTTVAIVFQYVFNKRSFENILVRFKKIF
jgi:O-antigen/teichoic acid export membrane protein